MKYKRNSIANLQSKLEDFHFANILHYSIQNMYAQDFKSPALNSFSFPEGSLMLFHTHSIHSDA